jgi:hypothetical protein
MNANEISPKASARLNRIKIVSRIARLGVIGFLLFAIWFLLRVWIFQGTPVLFDKLNAASAKAAHQYPLFLCTGILSLITPLILCVWYWKLAQLFYYYERGLIFAVKTIRCIKFLGLLCVINWMLVSTIHLLLQETGPGLFQPSSSQPMYRMEFFSFDFGWGIDFGPLLIGAIIVLIAWIMDEGRKIQEEQELTV